MNTLNKMKSPSQKVINSVEISISAWDYGESRNVPTTKGTCNSKKKHRFNSHLNLLMSLRLRKCLDAESVLASSKVGRDRWNRPAQAVLSNLLRSEGMMAENLTVFKLYYLV